ncbi:DNA-binding protein [Halarcobacter sp.]|uniref:helix-turn-helix transcriptional regulator n=1 Tax=Halarcobacter sp. TaxID=2321133 RepID=UPI002AAB1CB1|nr:DNA-binding protein [Halarcobacter sp.]
MKNDYLEQMNELYPQTLVLNQKQVSSVVGVSEATLSRWRTEGIGPEYKKIDNGKHGRILYTKLKIGEWLEKTIKTM